MSFSWIIHTLAMRRPTLDDLVQSLTRPSLARAEEVAMIKDYFHYSPTIALEIVKQYNSLPNPQRRDDPETRLSARFVRFYRINYPKVRKLNPKIALPVIQTVGESADWFLNQNLIDAATQLDQLAGERISLEGKVGLLYFLRQLVRDGLKPWETNLALLFETYREWFGLQKPSERRWFCQYRKMIELASSPELQEDWINRLLYRIAEFYSLPVPDEDGKLERAYRRFISEEPSPRAILKGLWTVRELCRYYNQHCAARPDFPFSATKLAPFVLSYMKSSDPDEEMPVLEEENIKTVEKVFRLIGQCQTLDEIRACAALDVPGYRITRRLGQGVYKEVYKGTNEISGGERALKIINISERGLANIKNRGLTLEQCVKGEAKKSEAVAKIGNPHLAQMYEIKQEPTLNDKYVISEELLERTIEELIKSGKLAGQLDAEKYFSKLRLLSYLSQIADGLAALHRHGFVHGDLTLSNIGIKEGKIKIIDFGLASTINSVAYETGERVNVGSILTRAPELFEGEKITAKADVWSLGIVAYMMATGKYPPFIPEEPKPTGPGVERENYEKEVQQRIQTTNWPTLVNVPEIPPRLQKVLHRCLQPNPEERATMSEVYHWLSEKIDLENSKK